MLIHLEWVDLCWKTTLIDKISLLFKNTLIFQTPKEYLPRKDKVEQREKVWKFYLERLEEIEKILKKDPSKIIILDRFYLSELVYGKIIRWYNSNDMEEYQRKVLEKIKEIDEKYWYAIIYLSDKTENIWKRYKEKGDDYIKDKKHYHNLKVEYWKKINLLEKVFKVLKINVFEQTDYRQSIIEELFLHNYVYKRDGQHN